MIRFPLWTLSIAKALMILPHERKLKLDSESIIMTFYQQKSQTHSLTLKDDLFLVLPKTSSQSLKEYMETYLNLSFQEKKKITFHNLAQQFQ